VKEEDSGKPGATAGGVKASKGKSQEGRGLPAVGNVCWGDLLLRRSKPSKSTGIAVYASRGWTTTREERIGDDSAFLGGSRP
jgi:hypothetical protein